MGGMEVRFPSPEAQAAGGYKRGGDNTPRTATIVRAVYWEDGEIFDHGKQESVPEFHYHLLDADGVAISHGDGYLSEEHVKAALEGVVEDTGVPIESGSPGKVDPADAVLGKFSATGSMHCPSCGGKVDKFTDYCPLCGEELKFTGGGE